MCGGSDSVGCGGGIGGGREYTPLYKNCIKKTQNKSMETTSLSIQVLKESFWMAFKKGNSN